MLAGNDGQSVSSAVGLEATRARRNGSIGRKAEGETKESHQVVGTARSDAHARHEGRPGARFVSKPSHICRP